MVNSVQVVLNTFTNPDALPGQCCGDGARHAPDAQFEGTSAEVPLILHQGSECHGDFCAGGLEQPLQINSAADALPSQCCGASRWHAPDAHPEGVPAEVPGVPLRSGAAESKVCSPSHQHVITPEETSYICNHACEL